MRLLSLLACTTLGLTALAAATTTTAAAQGYLERKDADAAAVIERAIADVGEDARLFDGRAIPAGADLAAVRLLASRFDRGMAGADRSLAEISAAGRQRHAAVIARYQTWSTYGRALVAAAAQAQAAADQAARAAAERDEATKAAGIATCRAFRDEVNADPRTRQYLDRAARLDQGVPEFWQTVEDGAAHLAAMRLARTACARADIKTACDFMTYGRPSEEGAWCAAVVDPDRIMKIGARNLARWHADNLTTGRPAEKLAEYEGWIEVEGGVTWQSYFSGAKVRAVLEARLAPVLAQAGLSLADDAGTFAKLDAHYAALEAKVRELAPTWTVPGASCKGVACAAAKRGVMAWNAGANLKKVTQDAPSWKIAKNALDLPTHRWKSGYALIQVKGDPMCQLRQWTVSESYAGHGRYQAASEAQLGYVRWQACR
ncbi:MAG: hypothetical protein JNK64_12890 [Myxococcales bacterium]|nr:hypothetical protein [Myxococcales bacterium]